MASRMTRISSGLSVSLDGYIAGPDDSGGVRLLDHVEATLRCTRVVDAPGVTHLAYDVVR